ncbi:MAG: hypothetical protein KatS3mg023_2547 [Armatimonadota bacterium]|nr:MAG: hypothetical protein KatS3mg023_2547 [Armatimonadota bacterium]
MHQTGSRWYEKAWRRAVIDMHIPDWDPRFLSQFSPDDYADALARARVQSVVLYVQSHTGLFNYPTKVGKQHANLKGRDLVAEMIEKCRRKGIAVVLYVSLIFDCWAFDNHPEWRGRDADGNEFGRNSRYGVVCPHSPYREYVRAWVEEMCERYDFDGVRFDMTFWPGVCYCEHCQRRWREEVGGEMPRMVDWTDERWVLFQRKREQWLADFAQIATSTVKRIRPDASVEHQASTYPAGWQLGVSYPLVAHNDFLEGDFYGDAVQGSFVRKLLDELTPNRPCGFETSLATSLSDHTGRKSDALLEAKASAAIADSAAFIFIDGIDPIGTLNREVYDRMGRLFDRLMPYYRELGGERVADVAVYYSLYSKFDMRGNGRPVTQASGKDTHTAAAVEAVRALLRHHLPCTVITARQSEQLHRFPVVVLPNVHHLSPGECNALREYVRQGGALYASGGTSLVTSEGKRHTDFLLADVFGVSLVKADWSDDVHYIAPTRAGADLFEGWSAKYPPMVRCYGFQVRSHPRAEILATTTLPWRSSEPTQFASIHSDPPWQPTDNPEIVFHRFGKGCVVYCATPIEMEENLQGVFIHLLRRLLPRPTLEVDAHPAVEVTLFHQPERKRYLLSMVNFQHDLPNIPIDGIRIRLRLPCLVTRALLLPEGKPLRFQQRQGEVTFTAPRLHTLAMFGVKYEG